MLYELYYGDIIMLVTLCILRSSTAGFAEQNGRNAELKRPECGPVTAGETDRESADGSAESAIERENKGVPRGRGKGGNVLSPESAPISPESTFRT